MRTYDVDANKSTSMGAMIFIRSGIFAGMLVLAPAEGTQEPRQYPQIEAANEGYTPSMYASTLSSSNVGMFEGAMGMERSFERVVSEFYSDLLQKQEPLGDAFSEVLADNLWDLYVRA